MSRDNPGLPKPRPEIAALSAYRPGTPPTGIRMHANESPYPPPADVMAEIADAITNSNLNRYPDVEANELRSQLSDYAGVDIECVWPGTGSNEILLNACLAYGGPGRRALLFEPTYAMHRLQATVSGMEVVSAPRGADMKLDVTVALEAIAGLRPDIVFVCSPDNPTGAVTPPEVISQIANAHDGLVICDEAYYEFSRMSMVPVLGAHPNVLVVRTLSKAFGLAGARLGYAVAHADVITNLVKVRMPYGQSTLAQVAATTVLKHRARLLERVDELIAERERVSAALSERAQVYESGANFILFRVPNAERVLTGLRECGVLVRDMTLINGCDGCLRVTVSTPEDNDAFLDALKGVI